MVRRTALSALLAGCILVLVACEVDVRVGVEVQSDGSGTVRLDVVLNDQAVAVFPDLPERLARSDLDDPASGWEVEGPVATVDGRTRYTATKQFGSPEQLQTVLDELISAEEVFAGFSFERSSEFARTNYELSGTVDLSGGVELFADEMLTELLGGVPFGTPVADIEAFYGAPVAELVPISLNVQLPSGGSQEIPLMLGQGPVNVDVSASLENNTARILRWVAWAAMALFVLAVIISLASYLLERRLVTADDAPPEEGPPLPAADRPQQDRSAQGVGQPAAPPQRRLRLVVMNPLGVLLAPGRDPGQMLADFVAERGSAVDPDTVKGLHLQATLGRISPDDLWTGVGFDDDHEELTNRFLDQYSVRSGARDFLSEMERRDLKVACLTNDIAAWSTELRTRHHFDNVEAWIVSSEVGVCMPDPGIYEALRRTTTVAYENSLLIDVGVVNLDTAKTLGMSTAQMAESRPGPAEPITHPVVVSFSDFFRRRGR